MWARAKSLLSLYGRFLIRVLSSNLFRSPTSCVCRATLAPPTATVSFNVAIIARWGRCQFRGDAGCPVAESLLSILDDEVLSQNAWPTYVASLSQRRIYTRELEISVQVKNMASIFRKEEWMLISLECKISNCLPASSCLPPSLMNMLTASLNATFLGCQFLLHIPCFNGLETLAKTKVCYLSLSNVLEPTLTAWRGTM